jgi:hypothetical protein
MHVASCYLPFLWGALLLYLAAQLALSALKHRDILETLFTSHGPALLLDKAAAVEVGWWVASLVLVLVLVVSRRG